MAGESSESSVGPEAGPDARRRIGVRLADPANARWVRLVARSSGPLPAGHTGAGQPSWIFADEIVVK